MLRHWCSIIACVIVACSIHAAPRADTFFTELNKDFGTVPRGPMLSHPFHVKNNSQAVLRISGVRVSCGCVTANALSTTVAPGEETAIMVQMDTTRFEGLKNVKIYVSFDQPSSQQVELWVQANSRDDVSVSPDAFNFGQVKRGTTPSASVTLTFRGDAKWQATGASCDSNYVRAALVEQRRRGYEVSYQLTAQLRADSPVGKWYTDIWVKTNNPATPRVRVPVNVEIESALSISPALVDLGQVKVGTLAQRKVIIRGIKPFRITEIKGADKEIAVIDTSNESRPVHVLAITLKPNQPGELKRQFRIQTDLKEEGEIDFHTRAQIMP